MEPEVGRVGQERLEADIQALARRGELEAAIELAIEGYGSGLYGYIFNAVGEADLARDIFQDLCLDLWEQLPRFEWRSSFKTWAYRLSSGAIRQHTARGPARREVRLHTHAQKRIHDRWTRTATMEWQKTESRERFYEACAELSIEDREIIALRLHQRMSWKDIAAVLEGPVEEAVLKRRASSLRKRFERIKDTLRKKMT